jgi:transposase
MRSADVTQSEIFSYRTLEQRIPVSHPLRKLRTLVDGILARLHADFEVLYAKTGRPSIPPERLLRASLIQTLYSIRSERQLVQHIDYNLLYRWFVGLDMGDKVWDHSSFTKNRDRLLNESVARAFFGKVLGLAQWHGLVSSDHFSVDGTLIEAWASAKSFKAKEGSGNRRKAVVVTRRWISRGKSARMIPMPRPPIRMPACSRKPKATSPGSAIWGTP